MKLSQRGLRLFLWGIWLFGSHKVGYIGCTTWNLSASPYRYLWFFVALLFFNLLIFPKVMKRDLSYIQSLGQGKHFFYQCQDRKSWLIMGIMMSFGIILRVLELVPYTFISGFYLGLAIAMLLVPSFYIGQALWNNHKKD